MRKKTKGRIQRFEERNEKNEAVQSPKKKSRLNGGRFALFILTGILVLALLMSVKGIFTLRAEQKALKEENAALLLEKESLEDELKNVSDKEYIEEQARIQLKLIKPGEILYILEEDKDNEGDNEKEDEKKD
mgnify:CR=1 FL=1